MKSVFIQIFVLLLALTAFSQDIDAPFPVKRNVSKPQVIYKDNGESEIYDASEVDKLPTYYFDDINGVFNYRISKEIENKLKELLTKKKKMEEELTANLDFLFS